MGFLDDVVITTRSGDGGRGCVSFRREKYLPKGGPDGGDGGDGGSVILKATRQQFTLFEYTSKRSFNAQNGKPGKGKDQSGKKGEDLVLQVPLGTVIEDHETGACLADLVHEAQQWVAATGGKGGKGNRHFATATNRTPRMAQPGLPGQEKVLRVSLKFIADIGLIGLPNAGKSTLLSRLTKARPKIENYPFTTLFPNLGTWPLERERTLIIADIPGLIEGASSGRGLGHRFLKHIERTRLLLHLLDITYIPQKDDILEDFHALMREMRAFSEVLAAKPQMVLINKVDLHGQAQRDLDALQKALQSLDMDVIKISALTGQGLESLKSLVQQKWMEAGGAS